MLMISIIGYFFISFAWPIFLAHWSPHSVHKLIKKRHLLNSNKYRILSAPGFVYTDKKIKKTFDYQPVVSSTGLTDTCFVPARACPFQLQMKPGPVRRWPGPAHAGRIVRGSRRRHHRGSDRDTLSRPRPCADFLGLFDEAAVANRQIARFTTGNNRGKGRPQMRQVQHVDMPTWSCVCWAPHVLLGRPLNFWHGYPVLQMIEKCSRFKT